MQTHQPEQCSVDRRTSADKIARPLPFQPARVYEAKRSSAIPGKSTVPAHTQDKGRSGDPAASRRTWALGVAASASAAPVAYMGNLLFKQGFTDPAQDLRHTRDNCIFCKIATDGSERALYQDEHVVVFPDIRPAASHHLLVISRLHVANTSVLQPRDLALVEHMHAVGQQVLLGRMQHDRRYGSTSSTCSQAVARGSSAGEDSEAGTAHSGGDVQGVAAAQPGTGLTAHLPKCDAAPSSSLDHSTCNTLSPQQAAQLQRRTKYGYHVAPFRSIDHLHLHCFGLPHTSPLIAFKYVLPGVWVSSAEVQRRLMSGRTGTGAAAIRPGTHMAASSGGVGSGPKLRV